MGLLDGVAGGGWGWWRVRLVEGRDGVGEAGEGRDGGG